MTTTLKLWLNTIKTTLTNIGGLIVLAILYALLLVSAYFFIATREATVWQVVVTYVLLILLPAEFFIFQASIIGHALNGKFHWRTIVMNAFKCFVVTIPVVLLAWGIYLLLNKWQLRYPPPVLVLSAPAVPPKSQPMHWPTLIFGTLRFVIFGVALPLAAIHLWIEVTACNLRESLRSGGKAIVSRLGRRFSGAFASESVLIYVLGLLVLLTLPYVILVPTFAIKNNKTEFGVFILRLLVSFVLTLIGWVVTVSTLANNTSPAPEARHVVAPA